MKRLTSIFQQAKQNNRGVLIAYFTVGDPDLATTEKAIDLAVSQGVDIIELGIPFSDPSADGPTIQAASQRALDHGFMFSECFTLANRLRQKYPDLGLIFMGYANPFFQYGLAMASKHSADAGVDGWIVPDVPFEETELLLQALRPHGVAFIPLLAPTTSPQRAKKMMATLKPPFGYYVSITGVTGARKGFPDDWYQPLEAFRSLVDVPVVVGFGVANAQLAQEAMQHADGVVVGSALVDALSLPNQGFENLKELLYSLRAVV